MIKFFSKIRRRLLSEGKLGRYITYAFGEIILVVIGILIALSINNWNEGRKDGLIEERYLTRLMDDLNNDHSRLNYSKGLSEDRIGQIDLLTGVIEKRIDVQENSTPFLESIEKVTWLSYLPMSRIVYNELLSSGKMSLISSEDLRVKLSDYYGTAEHWEMILNLEDAQEEFNKATAGLLSKEILAAIENNEVDSEINSGEQRRIDTRSSELFRIADELSTNKEATKWLPKIYQYHVLAKKVIYDLMYKNNELKEIIEAELLKKRRVI